MNERSLAEFRVLETIGQGAHGTVAKAVDLVSGRAVALKRVSAAAAATAATTSAAAVSVAPLPLSVLREILCLRCCARHPCIVRLNSVFAAARGAVVFLCFEYAPQNLAAILRAARFRAPVARIRAWSRMLLAGLGYLHSRAIVHRDIKPANLLIFGEPDHRLKICDFGQSRLHDPAAPMSHQVATRHYRAPELLFGARSYTQSIDCWAAGCVLGELFNHAPLFAGTSDIDQLFIVLSTLGTPRDAEWPQMRSLPDFEKIEFPRFPARHIAKVVPDAPGAATHLLARLLAYDGERRLSAAQALESAFLKAQPGEPNYESESESEQNDGTKN